MSRALALCELVDTGVERERGMPRFPLPFAITCQQFRPQLLARAAFWGPPAYHCLPNDLVFCSLFLFTSCELNGLLIPMTICWIDDFRFESIARLRPPVGRPVSPAEAS